MITAKEFRRWQASLLKPDGTSVRGTDIAAVTGLTPECISRYRNKGVPDRMEFLLRLAMSAIDSGLGYWKDEDNGNRPS